MSSVFLGAGLAPAGLSPAGYGAPATGSLIVSAPQTTSALDRSTRDYSYDASGNRVQSTPANQRVYLACLTALGSSSVPGFGLAPPPRTITKRYQQERQDAYQRAFADLQRDGVAQLISIQIDRVTGTHITETVRWRDLTTLDEQSQTF